MFKDTLQYDSDDPHQSGASMAPNHVFNDIDHYLAQQFLAGCTQPYLKRLGADDMADFFDGHTETRLSDAANQQFMKELKPEVLDLLMKKNMPVIGVFVGDEMVSGCAVLYPSDQGIAAYLHGYDFDGEENKTAVISAVWTKPEHGGKGYSKKAVDLGIDFAIIDGKEIFRAKVDKKNGPSLGLFGSLTFDLSVEGQDSRKVYPLLAL